MSSSLINSSTLAKSEEFRDLIRAAVVERAVLIASSATADAFSRVAVRDVDSVLSPFVRLAADDAVISTDGWELNEDDVRRVVQTRWVPISKSIPNLGA